MALHHNVDCEENNLHLLNQRIHIWIELIWIIDEVIGDIKYDERSEEIYINNQDNEPSYFDEIFSELDMNYSVPSCSISMNPSISCEEQEECYFMLD